jgi:hypothetical protein
LKVARASATFPQLKGDKCYVEASGKASTTAVAAARAVRKLFAHANVRGRKGIDTVSIRLHLFAEKEFEVPLSEVRNA